MAENNVKNCVFSGSCSVYGHPEYLSLDENSRSVASHATNPSVALSIWPAGVRSTTELWRGEPVMYANPALAEKELGFKAIKNLDDMCKIFLKVFFCFISLLH